MSSLTALMASLPPSSLAETDLARFCAQALGRRARAELPGLAALFGEESLRGYAPSLGPILQALVQTIMQQNLDPQSLDARTVDQLFGSAGFLSRLETRATVARQRLRPGTVIGAALRTTLGMRLTSLPGVGRELVLVAPVDLAQVPDARFTVPLGVVLARPANPDEAEVLRATWAVIEERFGLDGEEAQAWGARFVAISRLENHDAQAAMEGLASLEPAARSTLWDVLVAHLRDNELPEQHRTGKRALDRRLGELGYNPASPGGAFPPWVEATMTLAESAYRAAGLDPEVMAGRCPVPREDVERWSGWVDVAASGRERVKKMSVEQIEMALVRLAEEEAGRLERSSNDMPEPLARALASLRDGCLRPRWQRSRWALMGIDPLHLARARIASGEDTRALRNRLEALAHEATLVERAVAKPSRRKATSTAPFGDAPPPVPSATDVTVIATAIVPALDDAPSDSPAPQAAGRALGSELGPKAGAGRPKGAGQSPQGATDTAPASQPSTDGRGLRPSRFNLPPLPAVPPPRPAPRVRARTDFPPMPAIPPASAVAAPASPASPASLGPPSPPSPTPVAHPPRDPAARSPSQRVPSQRVASQRIPTVRPLPTLMPEPPPPSARVARPRTGSTAPHLVTPGQGNDFYDASFRELELIERDLVQRGPYAGAAERVQAITAEAAELHAALGPSARSGDREFQSAQKRIEKVQAYLERIRPLLAQSPIAQPGTFTRPPEARPTGLLGRLFGKKDT